MTNEEWNDIIDKMILAFENIIEEEDNPNYDETFENRLEQYKKSQEGLELFGKWYFSLWW